MSIPYEEQQPKKVDKLLLRMGTACLVTMLAVATVFMNQAVFSDLAVSFSLAVQDARFSFSVISLCYALAYFFVGPFVDSFNPRTVATMGLVLLSLLLGWASLVHDYSLFLVSMGMTGVAAAIVPAAMIPLRYLFGTGQKAGCIHRRGGGLGHPWNHRGPGVAGRADRCSGLAHGLWRVCRCVRLPCRLDVSPAGRRNRPGNGDRTCETVRQYVAAAGASGHGLGLFYRLLPVFRLSRRRDLFDLSSDRPGLRIHFRAGGVYQFCRFLSPLSHRLQAVWRNDSACTGLFCPVCWSAWRGCSAWAGACPFRLWRWVFSWFFWAPIPASPCCFFLSAG